MTGGPRAVLFDLYNTLVPGGTGAERDAVSHGMAEVLDVDPDALATLVRETFDERTRGRTGDLRGSLRELARRLGAAPSEAAVSAAADLRLDLTRGLLGRTWAVGALRRIGAAGVLRGVVSDCSAETPQLWAASPLAPHVDAVSFSCLTGARKPEPEAYLTAVHALDVEEGDCLYVGDGGSHELTGAEALGMSVLRFRAPGDGADVVDADDGWRGPVLTDLADLVPMLDPSRPPVA